VIQAAPSPAGVLKCGYMGTGRIRHRMLVLGLSGRVWSVLLPRSHPTKAHKCLQEGALVPCISVNLGNDDDKARTTRNLDPPRQTLKLLCTSSPLESHFLPTWHLPPHLAPSSHPGSRLWCLPWRPALVSWTPGQMHTSMAVSLPREMLFSSSEH
jgi:hypothetical protein